MLSNEIFENYIMSFICASTEMNKNNFFDSIYKELKEFGIKFNSEEIYSFQDNELSKNFQK